jgi:hypothetical protein
MAIPKISINTIGSHYKTLEPAYQSNYLDFSIDISKNIGYTLYNALHSKLLDNLNIYINRLHHSNLVGCLINDKTKYQLDYFKHEANNILNPDIDIVFELSKYTGRLDIGLNLIKTQTYKLMSFIVTSEKDYKSHYQYFCHKDYIIKCKTCQQELATYTLLDQNILLSTEGLSCKDLIVKRIIK